MAKQAIGDLYFELISAITSSPLRYEHYIPRSVVRRASDCGIEVGNTQSKSNQDGVRNVSIHGCRSMPLGIGII